MPSTRSKASRRRKAEGDRMLDVVAGSLTSRQAQIYQLVLRQDICGQALAAELGISEKEANDATYENQILLADGFDAYVLARMAFSCSARVILFRAQPGRGRSNSA